MTDQGPVLDQLNIVVTDMEAAVEFYSLLGAHVARVPGPWAPHHRDLTSAADGIDVELDSSRFASVWNRGWPSGRTGAVIGFRVASREAVDEVFQRMTSAGYDGQQEPFDAFWGARYAVVADPDGNSVGIMSPADPAERAAPPDPATM